MRRDDIPIQAIERRLDAGLTYAEIGEEIGLTPNAVRARVKRAGLDYSPLEAGLAKRLRIEAGKLDPLDAVEMLLGAIAVLASKIEATTPNVPKLTRNEHCLFSALWQRKGSVVSKETILNHVYMDRSVDEIPEIKIVDVFICKLRQKLPPQYQIETIWGRGYRLTEVERGNE